VVDVLGDGGSGDRTAGTLQGPVGEVYHRTLMSDVLSRYRGGLVNGWSSRSLVVSLQGSSWKATRFPAGSSCAAGLPLSPGDRGVKIGRGRCPSASNGWVLGPGDRGVNTGRGILDGLSAMMSGVKRPPKKLQTKSLLYGAVMLRQKFG